MQTNQTSKLSKSQEKKLSALEYNRIRDQKILDEIQARKIIKEQLSSDKQILVDEIEKLEGEEMPSEVLKDVVNLSDDQAKEKTKVLVSGTGYGKTDSEQIARGMAELKRLKLSNSRRVKLRLTKKLVTPAERKSKRKAQRKARAINR